MASLTTLIFDVDGTLADTERDAHRVAFNRAFANAGLNWQWSEDLYGALLTVAGGKERIRFFVERYRPALPHRLLRLNMGESNADTSNANELADWIARLHQAKTQYYTQIVTKGDITARPGVVRLIHEARQAGMRLAIATTSAHHNAIALIKHILHPDAPDWFEVIAAGDIVPAKKPAPDIYHYVLREMNLTPQECLVFEDSAHGLTAAATAGLPTVVTVNGYTRHQDFSKAVMVLDHLGEPDVPTRAIASRVPLSDPFTRPDSQYITVPVLRTVHHHAITTV